MGHGQPADHQAAGLQLHQAQIFESRYSSGFYFFTSLRPFFYFLQQFFWHVICNHYICGNKNYFYGDNTKPTPDNGRVDIVYRKLDL